MRHSIERLCGHESDSELASEVHRNPALAFARLQVARLRFGDVLSLRSNLDHFRFELSDDLLQNSPFVRCANLNLREIRDEPGQLSAFIRTGDDHMAIKDRNRDWLVEGKILGHVTSLCGVSEDCGRSSDRVPSGGMRAVTPVRARISKQNGVCQGTRATPFRLNATVPVQRP